MRRTGTTKWVKSERAMVGKKFDHLIYGIRAILETIRSGKHLEKVFVQKGIKGELMKELLKEVHQHQVPLSVVPQEKINRFTRKNHQGAVAFISPVQYHDLHHVLSNLFESGEIPLILLLDQITDVRNFGAIARTAECLGVHALLIPVRGGAQINPDAVKTSAGALNFIPVCRSGDMISDLRYLKESGLQLVSCTEKTDQRLNQVDFNIPTVLIMGSEDTGISKALLDLSDHKASIRMIGKISSLNVGAATAMALYEASKQRAI